MEEKEKQFDQFKKKEAFKVPENYFDEFVLKMQHTISEEKKASSWIDQLSALIQWRLSIPLTAVILLVISIGIIETDEGDPSAYQLSYAEASEYLIEEAAYLDDDELYELTYGLDETSEEEELDEEAIIDYLIEVEDMDLQLIENSIN